MPSIGKVTIVVLLRNLLVSRYHMNSLASPLLVLILLQRLIQNRRADDVKPAQATEQPGTLEANV